MDRIPRAVLITTFSRYFRSYRQGLLTLSQTPVKPPLNPVVAGPINIPTSPLAHHNYTWAQQSTVSVKMMDTLVEISFRRNLLKFQFPFCQIPDVTTETRTIITTSVHLVCAISITDIFERNSRCSTQCSYGIGHNAQFVDGQRCNNRNIKSKSPS